MELIPDEMLQNFNFFKGINTEFNASQREYALFQFFSVACL